MCKQVGTCFRAERLPLATSPRARSYSARAVPPRHGFDDPPPLLPDPMLRPPTPAILIGLLTVAACASGGVSAKPVRPRGVVTVAVMDTGGDEAPHAGSVARSASRSGRATGTSGAYRVHLEEPADAIPIGAVRWLEAVVTDTAGRRVAEAALLWQSSDTTVVTVPRVGRLLAPATGRGDGRALVTVSLGAATASVEVTVGRPAA